LPACVVGLCIDEEGMALTVEKKVAIAKRIYNIWANEYKFPPEDLIIDVLTFLLVQGIKAYNLQRLQHLMH